MWQHTVGWSVLCNFIHYVHDIGSSKRDPESKSNSETEIRKFNQFEVLWYFCHLMYVGVGVFQNYD